MMRRIDSLSLTCGHPAACRWIHRRPELWSRCGGAAEVAGEIGTRAVVATGVPSRARADRAQGSPWTRFDFVIIGAGPAGEAAAHKARELGATRRGRRPALVRRQLPVHRLRPVEGAPERGRPPRREPGRLRLAARLGPARLHGQPRRATRTSPTTRATSTPLEAAGARRVRGTARIVGRGPGRGPPRRMPSTSSTARNVVIAVGSTTQGAADRGDRADPDLVEPRGDARPRAAGQPARARRRTDRLRARPGLRPLRRPDDDRPVRAPAHADRPSAQLRDGPAGARRATVSRSGPASGRSGPAPAAGDGRRPRRSTSTTARPPKATRSCWPSAGRSRSTSSGSSTTGSTSRGGRRRSRATAGSRSPTGCGSSAIRPAPSSTPTRPTTRARSRSGWRSASGSSPTTGRCPRSTYTDPEAVLGRAHPRRGARARAAMRSR